MIQGLSPLDPSSYALPELAVVSHIHLNLTVDFQRTVLLGNVDLTVEKVVPEAGEVILDSKNLKIETITEKGTGNVLEYSLGEENGEFGSKLTVKLPSHADNKVVVSILYETDPSASGLQWLSPEQTAGKKHPYLFSQFQAIHARSVIPCQDTPAVKTKYSATIKAQKDLTVLMSAIPKETEITGDYKISQFEQKIPVPSYLIALAAGALESRQIGPRSHVWSEKEIIEDCAYEFADTEHQLKTAEDICGPYVWEIYDLLVLPPSFPFGGMENPCLTFVTPTLLAGDRSLANVVAHEIAHSWTGNLITNRNFEHFWLNEGFTVFVERKIKGRLSSPQDQDFDAYGRLSELREAISLLGEDKPLTKLVIDLKGVHPDDSFSVVPYEKGQTFLRYLETTVGGADEFEIFLRKYFDTFKYKSIITEDFKQFFEDYFSNKPAIKSIDWNTWLNSPGMPPVIPNYDKSRAEACYKLFDELTNWSGDQDFPISSQNVKNLTVQQRIYFLQKVVDSPPQPIKKLEGLDEIFNFSNVRNAEIKFRWLRAGLRAQWDKAVEPTLKWVNEVGRMKYVRPLYRDLYSWDAVRPKAIENFKANKQMMMHVLAYTLAQDLHLCESK